MAISTAFQSSHERSVEEVIDFIASQSPHAPFANDRDQLRTQYQAVVDSYHAQSKVMTADGAPVSEETIANWGKEDVTNWAKQVKEQQVDAVFPCQAEMLAVIRRAVELYHDMSPRATQLFTILTLLNAPSGTGRLAQVNTGEGKSLIVAMLAAIHALCGKKVDVVTTSIALSVPEVKKQNGFFEMLGLSVGENSDENNDYDIKKEIYQRDIVYGTADDFQGDILRTEFSGYEIRGNRGFGVSIVDEVDGVLFDNRSYRIQLTSSLPGTEQLEMVLATTWQQINCIAKQLIKRAGQFYYVTEDFKTDGNQITLFVDKDLEECLVPVEDIEDFIKKRAQTHLEQLLRDLSHQECAEWEDYVRLNARLSSLSQEVAEEENEAEKERKRLAYEQCAQEFAQLPWHKRYPIIVIPKHLKHFAQTQIPHWIDSALRALLSYKKEVQYDVAKGKIVPVDYENTGILQRNMVWSNGLAQFLQMKEGLRMTPENVSTNYLSTIGFLKRYGASLYGLTGTLGAEATQNFFAAIYGTDTTIIPPFKKREVVGNEGSVYLCKELPAVIVPTQQDWYDAICETTLSKLRNGRAALVICKHIDQVRWLALRLGAQHERAKIYTYTGQELFEKQEMAEGEVIVATNIAGRGTDLTPSEAVEANGGMHVCITFLPKNYRVELQNAGRTSRKGSRGSTQLILHDEAARSLATLRAQRNEKESAAIDRAKKDVRDILLKDRLFDRFCALENELLPTEDVCKKREKRDLMEKAWKVIQQNSLTPSKVTAKFRGHVEEKRQEVDAKRKTAIEHLIAEHCSGFTAEQLEKVRPVLEKAVNDAVVAPEITREEFGKQYEAALFEQLIAAFKDGCPKDVLECFRERKPLMEGLSTIAQERDWGRYERKALQERWGIWLKNALSEDEDKDEETLNRQFDEFADAIRKDAQNDQLIHNPYFYVQKGNHYLHRESYDSAIEAYDRAIALDPDHSVHAHYNKARALLSDSGKTADQELAKEELQAAKKLIVGYYQPQLLSMHSLVGQTGSKPALSEHVQHQLEILGQQKNHIDEAIKVIDSAQDKGWEVEVATNKLQEVFKEAKGDRKQAIREAADNGLDTLFTLTEKKPTPWWGIVGVGMLGIVQIATGVFITATTAGILGTGLISEGVGDMIHAVRSAISSQFSWEDWSIQKAINLAVSIVSAGWQAIKDGCKAVKDTIKGATIATTLTTELGKEVVVSQVAQELRTEGLKMATQQLGLALSKGIAKECISTMVNYGMDQTLMKKIEKQIEQQVEAVIMQALEEDQLVQQALAADRAAGNNYWQQTFIQEGLSLLKEDHSKLKEALCSIVKGIASNQSEIVKWGIKAWEAGGALKDVAYFTEDFMKEFSKKIEDHRQSIEEATAPAAASSPPTTREEIYIPSSTDKIQKAWSPYITSKLSNGVQKAIVRPCTDTVVNIGVERILHSANKAVKEATNDFYTKKRTFQLQKDIASASVEELAPQESESLTPEVKTLIKQLKEDHEGDTTMLALAARALEHPIALYDESGQLINSWGNENFFGKLIKLKYIRSPRDGLPGHYEPYDSNVTVTPTGTHTCLVDALTAQFQYVDPSRCSHFTAMDLKNSIERVAKQNPTQTHELVIAANALRKIDPEALHAGSGILAKAGAGALSLLEWLDLHPKIAAALSNAGTVIGSACWLCKATPAGLVTGWLVDEAYNKLVECADPNQAQERFSNHLQSLDEEMTKAQADALSSLTIKIAIETGRVAAHAGASKGFRKLKEKIGVSEKVTIIPESADIAEKVGEIAGNTGPQSFKSFSAFKRVKGPAGTGKCWHHIVEQTEANIAKFGAESIHTTTNLVKLPHGAGTIHARISGYYSSKTTFTRGKTVRQWLSSQSYQEQYDFGIQTLKRFGWEPES